MAKKILVIDDDRDLVASLDARPRGNGYDVARRYQRGGGAPGPARRAAGPRRPRRHDGDRHRRLRGRPMPDPEPPRVVPLPRAPGRPHRHPDGHRPGHELPVLDGPGRELPSGDERVPDQAGRPRRAAGDDRRRPEMIKPLFRSNIRFKLVASLLSIVLLTGTLIDHRRHQHHQQERHPRGQRERPEQSGGDERALRGGDRPAVADHRVLREDARDRPGHRRREPDRPLREARPDREGVRLRHRQRRRPGREGPCPGQRLRRLRRQHRPLPVPSR